MPAKVPDPIIRHDKQFSFPASIWLTRLRFTSPHTFVSWFLSMSVVVLLMKLVVEVTNHVTCQTGLFGLPYDILPYDIWFKAPLYSAPTPWHRTPTFCSVTTSEGTNILSCQGAALWSMKFDVNLILIAFSRDSACEPDALSNPNECAVLRPENR